MLAALTPSSIVDTSTSTTSNNNPVNANSPVNIRPNGSSFGWGNRERKMEENWRMQNRNI
jgi:hypothetical protein